MSKLTLESVQNFALKNGDSLISDFYLNQKQLLTFKCGTCSLFFKQIFKSYRQGAKTCNCTKKIFWTLEKVRDYISNNGDILMSNIYINNKTKLSIKCKNCQIIYEQTFDRYKRGYFHSLCSQKMDAVQLQKKKGITYVTKICKHCEKSFTVAKNFSKNVTCSLTCKSLYRKNPIYIEQQRENGKLSLLSLCRRSQNEIYFAELCKKHFSNVLTNEPLFEGFDADIVLPNLKIAIHWNGVWHYKPIRKGMDIEKIRLRDILKDKIIREHGYTPYTIKDLGSHDKKFVEEQFTKFLNYVYFV